MAELWDGVGVCQQQDRGFTAHTGDREMLILRIIGGKAASKGQNGTRLGK